jgi:hypothetical protein
MNLAGQVFGRLTAVEHVGSSGGYRLWKCVCACGGEKVVSNNHLRMRNTLSCGCLNTEKTAQRARDRNFRHGHNAMAEPSPTYVTWSSMLQRCRYSRHKSFKDYGGRGISVCDRWFTFSNFLNDMGERPAGRTLDRINPSGNYEPSNCRWATPSEQANNKRQRH